MQFIQLEMFLCVRFLNPNRKGEEDLGIDCCCVRNIDDKYCFRDFS